MLVRSSRDHHNPPTAVRGTLKVKTGASGEKVGEIIVEFPEMFTAPAHQTVIPLDITALASLTRNPRNGQLECTLSFDFENETKGRSVVAPRAQGGRSAS